MRYSAERLATIHLPSNLFEEMVAHCLRKLRGDYLPGEVQAPKAFGLIGGNMKGDVVAVEAIIPLFRNARDEGDQKGFMDRAMENHAIASVTPFDQRGWVAEQQELDAALRTLQARGLRLIGNYHMHRVAWGHDTRRDTPTQLDTILGRDSRMLMFIVGMVNPAVPLLRAFFEGVEGQEMPIEIIGPAADDHS